MTTSNNSIPIIDSEAEYNELITLRKLAATAVADYKRYVADTFIIDGLEELAKFLEKK